MAVISTEDLAQLRRQVAKIARNTGIEVKWLKGELNNAIQGIEDHWNQISVQNGFSNAIDSSTTFSFTTAQKRKLFEVWLLWKARNL